jgi:hypothetical protein
VALEAKGVVGFQTLGVGEVSPEKAPERIRKGLARHPIPLMVLARLAVAVETVARPWRSAAEGRHRPDFGGG